MSGRLLIITAVSEQIDIGTKDITKSINDYCTTSKLIHIQYRMNTNTVANYEFIRERRKAYITTLQVEISTSSFYFNNLLTTQLYNNNNNNKKCFKSFKSFLLF